MDPQIFTTMKHQMLDGKEKEIANRSSPLFKVIFIFVRIVHVLCKFTMYA